MWCERANQYGTIVLGPRRATSEWVDGLSPPYDGKTFGQSDVKFDNNLQKTLPEGELEDALYDRLVPIPSAFASQHTVAITLVLAVIVAIATVVSAVATVVTLLKRDPAPPCVIVEVDGAAIGQALLNQSSRPTNACRRSSARHVEARMKKPRKRVLICPTSPGPRRLGLLPSC